MDLDKTQIKHYVERKDIKGLVRYFGLEKFEEEIISSSRSSQRLTIAKNSPGNQISRIGGNPLLPDSFNWPHTVDNRPLSFLCQIQLSNIGFWAERYFLPPEGILSFFYDAQKKPWGMESDDKCGWKVLYFEEEESLREIPTPLALSEQFVFEQFNLNLEEELTFPDFQDLYSEEKDFTEPDSYIDFCEEWYQIGSRHRLLGFPQIIQNDIRTECQIVKDQIYNDDQKNSETREKSRQLETNAMNWELLLQIDSDEDTKMTWEDRGTLYFMIEKDKLLERAFDQCWLVLQCY